MNRKARFASQAWDDLREITDYIANDNPIAADDFVTRLQLQCHRLAQNPGIGRSRSELVPGMRSIAFGSYLIFYREEHGETRILRVIHGARKYETEFE